MLKICDDADDPSGNGTSDWSHTVLNLSIFDPSYPVLHPFAFRLHMKNISTYIFISVYYDLLK